MFRASSETTVQQRTMSVVPYDRRPHSLRASPRARTTSASHSMTTVCTNRELAVGSVASVDYLAGVEQPVHVHSGVGLGVGYRSPRDTWQMVLAYSYGFNAERSHGYGAQSLGLLVQWDLEAKKRRTPYFDIDSPYKSRGLFRIFGD